jgi:hypothetical protein
VRILHDTQRHALVALALALAAAAVTTSLEIGQCKR